MSPVVKSYWKQLVLFMLICAIWLSLCNQFLTKGSSVVWILQVCLCTVGMIIQLSQCNLHYILQLCLLQRTQMHVCMKILDVLQSSVNMTLSNILRILYMQQLYFSVSGRFWFTRPLDDRKADLCWLLQVPDPYTWRPSAAVFVGQCEMVCMSPSVHDISLPCAKMAHSHMTHCLLVWSQHRRPLSHTHTHMHTHTQKHCLSLHHSSLTGRHCPHL